MNTHEISDSFINRRRKEDLAFMTVRFMKAYTIFLQIYADFKGIIEQNRSFERCGLFQRIKSLEEGVIFDIKEKAHFLFRPRDGNHGQTGLEAKYSMFEDLLNSGDTNDEKKARARQILSDFRRTIVIRSIDSCVGTGFHLFMILRESLYQLEFYVPQYAQEHELLDKIETLAGGIGYEYSVGEYHEIHHLRQLDNLSQTITSDIKERADRAIEQCNSLFRETAEMLRHYVEESADNEVLVLNLLQHRELIEGIYGVGALEELFAQMYDKTDLPGTDGMSRAISYVRQHSGNITAIPATDDEANETRA